MDTAASTRYARVWVKATRVIIAIGAVPSLAFAQASPFQTGAQSLVRDFIAIATPFAILAIMILGVIALTGRISWGWPIGALVGVAIIFGAPQLVTWIRALFAV